MPKILLIVLLALIAFIWYDKQNQPTTLPASDLPQTARLLPPQQQPQHPQPAASSNSGHIHRLFSQRSSGVMVGGSGQVIRILADDNEGSRHQRFIIDIGSGHTLLVAHNIDLAPRIDDLRVNDTITFHGQYEYNDKGGVIHWTHHDPRGRHEGGWLEKNGRRYQ